MRYFLTLFLIFLSLATLCQGRHASSIDRYAASVGYYSIDSLFEKLALPSYSDSEKVRSFFYWITQHISYDIEEFHQSGYNAVSYWGYDTIVAKALEETDYLNYVMERRQAVCEGYAVIFKQLCDRAKIECLVVHGYGKAGSRAMGEEIKENHAWNAVQFNRRWHLLDVCWASGSANLDVTKFTKELNERYYLISPELMIFDHYPTDSQWTLLKSPPSKMKFRNFPYLCSSKCSIRFGPDGLNGIRNTGIGKSITIDLELTACDSTINHSKPHLSEYDREGMPIPEGTSRAKPVCRRNGNNLTYTYHVWSKFVSVICLGVEGNALVAYKLQVK